MLVDPLIREQELDALVDRTADICGVLNAAAARLVAEIADVVVNERWGGGWRSVEHWVAGHTGVSYPRAHKLVTIARRWTDLPVTMAEFAAGRLSEDQVYPIARHAPARRDRECCELAVMMTVPQIERVVASIPDPIDAPEPAAAGGKPREQERCFKFGRDYTGQWRMNGALPDDEAMLLEEALRASRNRAFRDRHPEADDGTDVGDDTVAESGVTWADALVRMAEISVDHDDPATRDGRHPSERYQTFVHVDAHTGIATDNHGHPLPDQIWRLLACDTVIRVVARHDGIPVELSSPHRTVDPKMRALIEHRDQGCRYPGCRQRRWLHIHHIIFREHHGQTVWSNLCCLCPFHHRQLHAGKFTIRGDPSHPDGLEFHDQWHQPIGLTTPRPPGNRTIAHDHYKHPYNEQLDMWAISWN